MQARNFCRGRDDKIGNASERIKPVVLMQRDIIGLQRFMLWYICREGSNLACQCCDYLRSVQRGMTERDNGMRRRFGEDLPGGGERVGGALFRRPHAA